VQVNVGEAKTRLSQLLALAEAGEEVEIARDGVPVVRLVPVPARSKRPGEKFLAAFGSMRDSIDVGDDFEFSEAELDEILGSGDGLNDIQRPA
jgi:prevent-host-death family protein